MRKQLFSSHSRTPAGFLGGAALSTRSQSAVGILFLAVLPLTLTMMTRPNTANLLIYGGLLALFLGAFYSISLGIKNAKRRAEHPTTTTIEYPGKLIGSGLLGLGVAVLTGLQGSGLAQICFVGLIAFVLSMVTFGRDPSTVQEPAFSNISPDRELANLRARVETRVDRIMDKVLPVADIELTTRLHHFADAIDRLVCVVEKDPKCEYQLKKYFGTYLAGATDAANRFVAIYRVTGDAKAHASFTALLIDLARVFDTKAAICAQQTCGSQETKPVAPGTNPRQTRATA